MLNIYDYLRNHAHKFRQFKVDELLFAEYHCLIKEAKLGAWTHNNFFTYVLSGNKGVSCGGKDYLLEAGDCFFMKKGAYIAHQYFDEEYCAIIIFVPDDFIKKAIQKHRVNCPHESNMQKNTVFFRLNVNALLSNYFQSVLGYFQQEDIPPAMLMKVKFEELIVNITTANSNVPLACYFKEICTNKNISIREVMESNFMYNMTLEEYARICGRSLSSFRRDFKSIFGISPGSWLTKKRLEYGKYLLETTDKTIEAITFESGFANASHFIRIFKTKYGKSPIKYKK